MGKNWKQLKDSLNKADKNKGRLPKLVNPGNYKLLVKKAHLIREEDSKNETNPDLILYSGLAVEFKVLEAQGPEAISADVDVEKVFWLDGMEKWQKDRNFRLMRSFIETVTGEDIGDLGDDMIEELSGFVVYCQVELSGDKRAYPQYNWAHIPQTAEDVLLQREGLSE